MTEREPSKSMVESLDKRGRVFGYQRLEVWQLAKELAVSVYSVTRCFPQEEKFGLTSQLTRAAVSVASNIAEGSGRTSLKDQAHFTQTAYGSLMELACQFEICRELGFIAETQLEEIHAKITVVADKLSALRKSQLRRSANNS